MLLNVLLSLLVPKGENNKHQLLNCQLIVNNFQKLFSPYAYGLMG